MLSIQLQKRFTPCMISFLPSCAVQQPIASSDFSFLCQSPSSRSDQASGSPPGRWWEGHRRRGEEMTPLQSWEGYQGQCTAYWTCD